MLGDSFGQLYEGAAGVEREILGNKTGKALGTLWGPTIDNSLSLYPSNPLILCSSKGQHPARGGNVPSARASDIGRDMIVRQDFLKHQHSLRA